MSPWALIQEHWWKLCGRYWLFSATQPSWAPALDPAGMHSWSCWEYEFIRTNDAEAMVF